MGVRLRNKHFLDEIKIFRVYNKKVGAYAPTS